MVIHSPQRDKEYRKQEEGQITAEQEALQDYILSATVIVRICLLDYIHQIKHMFIPRTHIFNFPMRRLLEI